MLSSFKAVHNEQGTIKLARHNIGTCDDLYDTHTSNTHTHTHTDYHINFYVCICKGLSVIIKTARSRDLGMHLN